MAVCARVGRSVFQKSLSSNTQQQKREVAMQSYKLAKRYLFKTTSTVLIVAMSASNAGAVKFPSKKNRYMSKPLQVCDQGVFYVGGAPKTTRFPCRAHPGSEQVDHHRPDVCRVPDPHEGQGVAAHHGARLRLHGRMRRGNDGRQRRLVGLHGAQGHPDLCRRSARTCALRLRPYRSARGGIPDGQWPGGCGSRLCSRPSAAIGAATPGRTGSATSSEPRATTSPPARWSATARRHCSPTASRHPVRIRCA